jgi:HD superfamily phosphohydrolase
MCQKKKNNALINEEYKMENKIQEVTKQEYVQLLQWLFGKDVEIKQEKDITFAHDYEYIEIYDLFQTKAMQRLGKIIHLGSLIYSNQNNYFTRLEHSKQAYYRCIEFLALQSRNPEWKKYIEDTRQKGYLVEKIKFMCVHDIGHTMFSHSMEKMCVNTHEDIGRRIIQEDIETKRALDNIKADEVNSNLKGDGSLELFCEGNIDFDRMAYLPTDMLFTGKKYTNDLMLRLESMCKLKQISKNGEMRYVYGSEALDSIKEFLKVRDQMYKEEYYNKQSQCAEYILNSICKKVVNGEIVISEEFEQILNRITDKDIKELDIDAYLQTNDMFFLNQLMKQTTKTQEKEKLLSMLIPNKMTLLQMAINMIDPKNREEKLYSSEEKEFIYNIKQRLKEDEKEETCKDIITLIESTEDKRKVISKELSQIFGVEENIKGIEIYAKRYCKYNEEEPIYIQSVDGKIYPLEKYPNIDIDLRTQYQYGVCINKIELQEQEIEKERIEQFIQLAKEIINPSDRENHEDVVNRMSMLKTETNDLVKKASQFFDDEER